MLRRLVRWSSWLAYALALGVVFALAGYAAFNQYVRRGVVPVPDLVGLPLAEAESLLAEQELELRWLESEDRYDDSVSAGRVLQHAPPAGGLVKQGSRVEVVLSLGQQKLEMPDLVGQAVQAAQVTLVASGFDVGRRGAVHAQRGERGTVVHQFPPAGSSVQSSTPVELLVASENSAAVYVMPDLVYRDGDVVRAFFTRRGFRMGSVKYEPYEGVTAGTILRQYPLPGHPLRRDEPIALVVAAPDAAG